MTVRPQDLGGRHGFGPVPIEQDEPVFHADWEASVIAGILATIYAGLYNVDQFREGIDELEPLSYLTLGYYRRWLHTLEVNCMKSGLFSAEELEARIQAIAQGEQMPIGENDEIAGQLRDLIYFSTPAERPVDAPPAFAVGDAVRGRVLEGRRHARIPLYAQGKRGVVLIVNPAFPDPDRSRLGEGEHPEHVYSVSFAGRELWPDADEHSTVVVDLWESYLEPASAEGAP
jgi:nitrile hydratase subunit beta